MKLLILAICLGAVFCEIKEEKDVLVLTTDNFDTAVTDDAMILVEFCEYLLFEKFILFLNTVH